VRWFEGHVKAITSIWYGELILLKLQFELTVWFEQLVEELEVLTDLIERLECNYMGFIISGSEYNRRRQKRYDTIRRSRYFSSSASS
jgi:hypothetical protein